jgi:hypothetical protein
MGKTQADLVRELNDTGTALLRLEEDQTVGDVRRRLIAAARDSGKRVSVKRSDADRDNFEARVLSPDEAKQQARQAAIKRAMRLIKDAEKVLRNEGEGEFVEYAEDLYDILLDLEDDLA